MSGMENAHALVLGIERPIEQSKRTLAVISRAYLPNAWTGFLEFMTAHPGIQERQARVLPLVLEPARMVPDGRGLSREVALHLGMLVSLNLNERHIDQFTRLIRTLQSPLPRAWGR